MEAAVGAFRRALSREHPRRVFAEPAVRIHAAGIGIAARQVFTGQETEQLAPVPVAWRSNLGNLLVAQRLAVVLARNLAAANFVAVGVTGDRFLALRPFTQELDRFRRQFVQRLLVALPQHQQRSVAARRQRILGVRLEFGGQGIVAQRFQRFVKMLQAARKFGLAVAAPVDLTALLGDLRKITDPAAGNHRGGARLFYGRIDVRGPAGRIQFELRRNPPAEFHEHPADAGIIELAGNGRVHRHFVVTNVERDVVSFPLLADVAQGVFGAPLVEFIEHDQIGEVEHVDLLELAGGTVITGHHVDREIHEIHDLAVALPDAGRLHDDEVEAERLEEQDVVAKHLARRKVLPARRNRTHEHPVRPQGIHSNTVTQQGAARAPPRRIHRKHGDMHLGVTADESIEDFVGDAALSGAAGAGDADDGRAARFHPPLLAEL